MASKIQNSQSLQAVLQNQQAAAVVQQTVNTLRAAIDSQRAKADQLNGLAVAIAQLEIQREDLLSDIAIGQNKTDELKRLEEILAEKRRDLSDQGTQAAIEDTVAGLQRKLERAESERVGLREEAPGLMRRLLLARAEELGLEYAACAKATHALYMQLSALGLLLQENGSNVPFVCNASLSIPSFYIDVLRPLAAANHGDKIASSHGQTWASFRPMVESEKEFLQSLGVVLVCLQ